MRKEVIALLKAGTLTTNIIHKLRFLIGDIGKVVSMVMLMFHGASCVRSKTLSIVPRDILAKFASLSAFLLRVTEHSKIIQEAKPFDYIFHGFVSKPSVRLQFMQILKSTFTSALDESHLEVLRYLFILVPAMSLDHIESMRSLKNQYQGSSLNKVAANTEDSFAVGVSFLLSMLNQVTKFEAFHWFKAATRDYRVRMDRIEATTRNKRSTGAASALRRTPDLETQRNMDLLDSLKGIMSELKLLEHSMLCAKIFFQKRNAA